MTRGDIAHSGRQEETMTKIGQRHNRERLTEGKKKKKKSQNMYEQQDSNYGAINKRNT